MIAPMNTAFKTVPIPIGPEKKNARITSKILMIALEYGKETPVRSFTTNIIRSIGIGANLDCK